MATSALCASPPALKASPFADPGSHDDPAIEQHSAAAQPAPAQTGPMTRLWPSCSLECVEEDREVIFAVGSLDSLGVVCKLPAGPFPAAAAHFPAVETLQCVVISLAGGSTVVAPGGATAEEPYAHPLSLSASCLALSPTPTSSASSASALVPPCVSLSFAAGIRPPAGEPLLAHANLGSTCHGEAALGPDDAQGGSSRATLLGNTAAAATVVNNKQGDGGSNASRAASNLLSRGDSQTASPVVAAAAAPGALPIPQQLQNHHHHHAHTVGGSCDASLVLGTAEADASHTGFSFSGAHFGLLPSLPSRLLRSASSSDMYKVAEPRVHTDRQCGQPTTSRLVEDNMCGGLALYSNGSMADVAKLGGGAAAGGGAWSPGRGSYFGVAPAASRSASSVALRGRLSSGAAAVAAPAAAAAPGDASPAGATAGNNDAAMASLLPWVSAGGTAVPLLSTHAPQQPPSSPLLSPSFGQPHGAAALLAAIGTSDGDMDAKVRGGQPIGSGAPSSSCRSTADGLTMGGCGLALMGGSGSAATTMQVPEQRVHGGLTRRFSSKSCSLADVATLGSSGGGHGLLQHAKPCSGPVLSTLAAAARSSLDGFSLPRCIDPAAASAPVAAGAGVIVLGPLSTDSSVRGTSQGWGAHSTSGLLESAELAAEQQQQQDRAAGGAPLSAAAAELAAAALGGATAEVRSGLLRALSLNSEAGLSSSSALTLLDAAEAAVAAAQAARQLQQRQHLASWTDGCQQDLAPGASALVVLGGAPA